MPSLYPGSGRIAPWPIACAVSVEPVAVEPLLASVLYVFSIRRATAHARFVESALRPCGSAFGFGVYSIFSFSLLAVAAVPLRCIGTRAAVASKTESRLHAPAERRPPRKSP